MFQSADEQPSNNIEGLEPKRQVNRKFIQNAALKFRRQLITNNQSTTGTSKREHSNQRSNINPDDISSAGNN
jgi:hypothetical protein